MSILNEQLRYYRESPDQDFCRPTQKNCDPHKDPRKNIFDPCNPRKNFNPRKNYFDPRNPRNPRNILNYTTHAHTDPRNTRTHVTQLPRNPYNLADSFTEQQWMTASTYVRILTAIKFQYKKEEEGEVNYSSLHTSAIKGTVGIWLLKPCYEDFYTVT